MSSRFPEPSRLSVRPNHGRVLSHRIWSSLTESGLIHFPAWAPRTLRDARVKGQQTIEALVGRHRLHNAEVRDLVIGYLRRRSAEVDYSTLDNLVRNLVQYFWKVVEDVNPGQADLRLGEQTVQEWKHVTHHNEHACLRCQMLSVNPKMLPRLDEIEEDLIARRRRAISEGWRGEVEGLELTLTFLRSKRDQARRAASMGTVSPGMPVVPRR